jgi:hypothetical protein
MYKRLPNFVKSVFVVYPRTAMMPKDPDAAKNVSAMDPMEYNMKMKDKLSPIKME